MFKKIFFVSAMAGMIGMPYLVSESSNLWKSATARFQGGTTDTGETAGKAGSGAAGHSHGHRFAEAAAASTPKSTGIEGHGVRDLSEVLQFDATPAWVIARWPRVTSGLAELDLQGYRVPLVTGTGQDDLAGSLTYYFDRTQRMTRIDFHGTTGDPRKIISLVTTRYSFEPQTSTDPGMMLYQVRWNGKALSELRIRPSRVVRADQPFTRYEVQLAMKRP